MAESKPGGIVNHPWLALFGLFGICIALQSLSTRTMCDRPICNDAKVYADIRAIHAALGEWHMSHSGEYPDSLQVLVAPEDLGQRYLGQAKLPRDRWGRDYIYMREPLNVMTLGADGKPGGTGDDRDIDYISILSGP